MTPSLSVICFLNESYDFQSNPVPSCLFKSCVDSICPVVLRIINASLCSGVVPAAFQIVAVTLCHKLTTWTLIT